MGKRQTIAAVLLGVLCLTLVFLFRKSDETAPASPEPPIRIKASGPPPGYTIPYPPAARELMREGSTAQDDLKALANLLALYRSSHRDHASRPLGLNREFTAALTKKNEYGLALLPADHPAINADGELVDRWGSPYQFHPLSSDLVEIRSAGPDRRPYTDDDLVHSPISPEKREVQFNP